MYPVPEKVQSRQVIRDERAIERALEVMGRLNLAAEYPGALALAQEKIENGAPDNLGTVIYPVADKALRKQINRDRRVIDRAIDVVERMRVSPHDRMALYLARTAVDEHKRELDKQAVFVKEVEAANPGLAQY